MHKELNNVDLPRILTIACLLLFPCVSICAQSSVLSSGKWYKVAITERGVYRITGVQLKKMGFDLSSLDPSRIKVYGNVGGMLPQSNAVQRPEDLQQIAIHVDDGGDGKINNNDFLLFYGEGPDHITFDSSHEIFQYNNNPYSDTNYYFITVGNDSGKRVSTTTSLQGAHAIVQRTPDFYFHENDEVNLLASGREWFGERLNGGNSLDFNLTIHGMIDDAPLKFVTDVVAQAYGSDASFTSMLNDVTLTTQNIFGFADSQYGLKGVHNRDTILTTGGDHHVASRSDHRLTFQYTKAGIGAGYIDFFLLSYWRSLALYGNQSFFNSFAAQDATATFTIGQVSTPAYVWDITDPYTPRLQETQQANGQLLFSANTATVRSYVVFNGYLPTPQFIGEVSTQNLRGLSTPQLIIIAHPDFVSEANRLAAHRSQHSGWSVVVTTPDKIYNEFSSGRQDVSALRDFVKHLYDKSPGMLKAVLMFGKGSYDYKGHLRSFSNFVPTYESRNSLAPLETYSSDDYFGFLDTDEGEWLELPPSAHDLEVGVGRLPVKSLEEAHHVVDKIIQYDNASKNFGSWRKDIVFVADDGNNTDKFSREHQSQANTLANEIETVTPEFNTRKIFLGTYPKTVRPNGETIPQVNEKIREEFFRGALLINYTGHGSEYVWADEKVLTEADVDDLENKHYPFLVTATCEFGRQDNPDETSSAERSLVNKDGGSIGLVTTTRPVFSINNYFLNQAFYDAVFQRENGRYRTLSEIFRETKNNSDAGVGNRNFSLMADPSMTLALPSFSIQVDSIKTTDGSDTLKALSTVVVKGSVRDVDENIVEDFNGVLESILFDKQTDFVTIGKNNPAFNFKQWHNALYRGKASVRDGHFEFELILPKNIAYEVGEGKMSLYAYDASTEQDASGASKDFKIGNSQANPSDDNTPPVVELFIGDTTFVAGGLATPNTTLVVKLRDDSGINISNYGIGNNMIAILDNSQTFTLSDYYTTALNTYKIGWINYPLRNLSPGRHMLTVKVWDTHNNPSQASIEFFVSDSESLEVELFGNYPNPFENETKIFFRHNRSGDDLMGELYIYDRTGQQLKTYAFTVEESEYEVKLLDLNAFQVFGKKLPGGLYLARLSVRSVTNGSKTEVFTKLIVLN